MGFYQSFGTVFKPFVDEQEVFKYNSGENSEQGGQR
jgi:hypothetical protein